MTAYGVKITFEENKRVTENFEVIDEFFWDS
jgi:hypothetical protein